VAEKRPDAALADLNKAPNLDPRNVDAFLARARLRVWGKDPADAEADATSARQLAPAGAASPP
jgi:hypothetical protein